MPYIVAFLQCALMMCSSTSKCGQIWANSWQGEQNQSWAKQSLDPYQTVKTHKNMFHSTLHICSTSMENNTANRANFSPTSSCYLAFLPRLERSVGLVGLTKLHNAPTQPVSDGTWARCWYSPIYRMGPHCWSALLLNLSLSSSIYSSFLTPLALMLKNHALRKLWPAF